MLEVWASWCSDCVKGMPDLKEFKSSHQMMLCIYFYLLIDLDAWKRD